MPAGASIQIDKADAEKLEVQTCDNNGCYAAKGISPSMLVALEKAETVTVTFQNLNKQNITLPLPMKGFTSAYEKLP